jgi:CheY-like chemotaxis protein
MLIMSEPTATILMIDDDPDFVDFTTSYLEANGYKVETAFEGEEGLKKAGEVKPNLILLDVMMETRTEGFKVARELSENEQLRDIPIIMMTGIKTDMNLPFGFEPDDDWLPVTEYMEKPIDPAKLVNTISRMLDKADE